MADGETALGSQVGSGSDQPSFPTKDTIKLEDLETLRQFFGAHFHQDWVLDAAEPDQIIGLFIQDQGERQI